MNHRKERLATAILGLGLIFMKDQIENYEVSQYSWELQHQLINR